MDKIVSYVAGLGIPGLIFLTIISTTGLSGAAAYTAALATIGPGGMLGGLVTLGAIGLISEGLTKYGFDAIFNASVKELYKRGENKESILKKIEKYPVTNELKMKLRDSLNKISSEN